MTSSEYVSHLNHTYFSGKLSAGFLQQLATLPLERKDVLSFVERSFRLMKRGGHPAEDLSSLQGGILGSLMARILPGAWEGKVPPITVAGRHVGIDDYFSKSALINGGPLRMLDIGCGFPPHTTLETAARFPEWHITAADPSLPMYLVYDGEGNYCTFDEDREPVYFQPAIPSVENWNALLADAPSTRARFRQLLDELILAGRDDYADDELPRLRIDPVHRHSTSNLHFIRGGIGEVELAPVDVIRCCNVLFYFNDQFRQDAVRWLGEQLNPGGVLLTGSNWALSTENRYTVFHKSGDGLEPKEFAFSLDNFSPVGIVTWYTNLDDDREVAQLADYLAILRRDKAFSDAFYALNDDLHARYGICPRDEAGYYSDIDHTLTPTELWTRVWEMKKELHSSALVDMAVGVLRNAGLEARVNEAGDVAVGMMNG